MRRVILAAALLASTAAFAGGPDGWRADRPGQTHEIKPARPAQALRHALGQQRSRREVAPGARLPAVPPGFTVTRFAQNLDAPRTLRVAPNGDIFVAEKRQPVRSAFCAPSPVRRRRRP